jgi:lysine 2,3-aminomutase
MEDTCGGIRIETEPALTAVRTPIEHFREKTTPFIRQLSQHSQAIRSLYTYDPSTERAPVNLDRDILHEKRHSPVKGAVYKFSGRILILLSYTCAANCRYCERQDRVGVGLDPVGYLREREIEDIVSFIARNREITEIIFSGGDPLMNPKGLKIATNLLSTLGQIKIVRIHTRLPVQDPSRLDLRVLDDVSSQFKTCYFNVHIDHPDELTGAAEDALLRIRRMGYVLLAQTVFLKGINDNVQVLRLLFTRMAELGIRPYYLYHCQAIPTTMKFVVPLAREIEIVTELREQLSGIAFPQHVIDLQHTKGKVLVPTNHWNLDMKQVRDFYGNWLSVADHVMNPLEP